MKKIFFKFQLQSVEYSVYVSLEILKLVIGIILRFGNQSLLQLQAAENPASCKRTSVTVTQFYDKFYRSSVIVSSNFTSHT